MWLIVKQNEIFKARVNGFIQIIAYLIKGLAACNVCFAFGWGLIGLINYIVYSLGWTFHFRGTSSYIFILILIYVSFYNLYASNLCIPIQFSMRNSTNIIEKLWEDYVKFIIVSRSLLEYLDVGGIDCVTFLKCTNLIFIL